MKTITRIWYAALVLSLSLTATCVGAVDTLTLVKLDGSRVSFSVEGLKITYDDFVHATVTNSETTSSIAVAELDYMRFENGDTPSLTGDVNGDGEVNLADVNVLIDVVLNGVNDSDIAARADVNDDGEINLADVNAVVAIILN